MTAPEYLDPVRHELHQLRAKIAAVRAEVDDANRVHKSFGGSDNEGAVRIDRLRTILADKEPTP